MLQGIASPGETELVPGAFCCQESGMVSMNWAYVGHGNGAFQSVRMYSYVGQGRGSYELEEVVIPARWNMQKICIGVSCLAVLLVVLALVVRAGVGHLRGTGNAAQPSVDVASVSYDCETGYDNWALLWTDAQKGWCCMKYGRGCAPKLEGCNTLCNFMRKTGTCKFRIQWGANHRYLHQPEACAQAHQMVLGQCPYCAGCQLADAGCHAAPVLPPQP